LYPKTLSKTIALFAPPELFVGLSAWSITFLESTVTLSTFGRLFLTLPLLLGSFTLGTLFSVLLAALTLLPAPLLTFPTFASLSIPLVPIAARTTSGTV
jgi:hypothetical protein